MKATKRRVWVRSILGAAACAALMGSAWAQETLKIGVLATLEGPFAVPGQDGMRGADMALKEKNGMAGGKKIEFVKVSSDATPDKAVAATRKAVEQDKVQIMIGPLSGDEGIAVKNYAKTQARHHLHQRLVGRAGDDAERPGAELLPLQHRRRAVDGGPGRARARQGLQEGPS